MSINNSRSSRRSLAVVAICAAGALVLSACGGDAAGGDSGSGDGGGGGGGGDIVIGVVQPLTGAAALSAAEIVHGVELAVEEINDDGGVDGRMLVIEEYDTKLDPATAVQSFTEAVSQGGAAGVVGPYGTSEVQAIAPSSTRLETPFISPTVSTTSVTNVPGAEFTFRSGVVNSDVTARNISMAEELGCAKPALLHDDGGYGADYQKSVAEQIAPLKLATTQSFPVAATDVTPQVQSAKAAGADCVLAGASAGATLGLVIRTMVDVGLDVPVIGPDSLVTADAREVAGEAINGVDGVYAVQALDREKPEFIELLERYEEAYGDTPVSAFWVSSYDATHLLAAGLARSGGEGGVALRDALEELTAEDYVQVYGASGAEGGYSADDHNWLGGDYLTAYEVSPDGAEAIDLG